MNIELNNQQIEFILDEVKDVLEGQNYSQYAKTIAQQLYDKLVVLIAPELADEEYNREMEATQNYIHDHGSIDS